MFSEKTDKLVDELVEAEYKNAVEQYGERYANKHEAFCILQEEILEAWNEVDFFNRRIVPRFLNTVNEDGNICLQNEIRNVIDLSRKAIKELAQVCAVCEKFEATIGAKDTKGGINGEDRAC